MEHSQKSSPKDVFMHLLMVITLYVAAGSLVTLWFQYINLAFPDPLRVNYGVGGAIRWSLAILIILFPVFLWVSRSLEKDIAKHPEKAGIRVRKWLVYLTLFVASILIIGDLVTLIYNFLEGDLTARFLLKVLAVLLVAGAVFGYYLFNLRKRPGSFSSAMKSFVWIVIIAVIVSIIYGFFVAGSPFKQRLVRFDEQKINDLQTIQNEIVAFWQQKDRLPNSLNELRDSISGFMPPRDSQTNESYIYRVTGSLSFELCAEFNLSTEEVNSNMRYALPVRDSAYPGIPGLSSNWEHDTGEACFSRTIDPELYGIEKPILIR